MPIPVPDFDVTEQKILAIWRNRFPGRALDTESFLGKLSRAETMVFYLLLQAVVSADNDATPNTSSSDAAIERWAVTVGVPNGAGGYGRKQSTSAIGLTVLATGVNGTVYANGITLTASDGSTSFTVVNGPYTIPGTPPATGNISLTLNAVTGGTGGNLAAGAIITWDSAPAGSDASVTVTSPPSTLGINLEAIPDLLIRILDRFQSPPKGGTSADFRAFAEGVAGVSRAYPYPLRGGIGTEHNVIVSSGSGQYRLPTSAVQTAVDAAVALLRPVTSQGYKTILPYMPAFGTGPGNTGGLVIRARMVPSLPKYNFDWDDTSGFTVAGWAASGGPVNNGATVTLSADAPASLVAAITAKTLPRLQILNSGVATGSLYPAAVPVQVQVIGYSGSGNRVLELLSPLPLGFVGETNAPHYPVNGDAIYAGGPMVSSIGTAISSYIDSLGPSRAGGYADINDFWESVAAVARITQIALDQKDTDRTPFASNIKASGVTIANGTNAPAANDVSAQDNTVNGPELLYTRFVAVTQ